MLLRDWIKRFEPLNYIVQQAQFSSHGGREYMLGLEYSSQIAVLVDRLALQQSFISINNASNSRTIEQLNSYLSQIREIRSTLSLIASGGVVCETELFELKRFAYFADKISCLLVELKYSDFFVDPLKEIFDLLDPQHSGSVTFYIYDNYCPQLAALRKELTLTPKDSSAELYERVREKERDAIANICMELKPLIFRIKECVENLAKLDFVVAITTLYQKQGFAKPQVSDSGYEIIGVFNPIVKDRVCEHGGVYQSIDIAFGAYPTLIHGANMSGKSVMLGSVAICQLLMQFGLFVPALSARMMIKSDVMISFGDSSSLRNGLSSFGAEIMILNDIVLRVGHGEDILVLVDEAARTTNPVEGVAIVSALIEVLAERGVSALVTTHYSGIKAQCRCLRVKGLSQMDAKESVSIDTLNRHMDYSLVESIAGDAPHEALNVAKALGVDSRFLEIAKKHIIN